MRYQMVLSCGFTTGMGSSIKELFDRYGWQPDYMYATQDWYVLDTKTGNKLTPEEYASIVRKVMGYVLA